MQEWKSMEASSNIGRYPRGYAGCKDDNMVANKLYILRNGRKFRYFNYNEQYEANKNT